MAAFGSYVAIGVTGLVHGLEPGHGWPLAVVLARRRQSRPLEYALAGAMVLGLGHLVSSFAAVGVYVAFAHFFDLSSRIIRYVAAAVLLVIAYRLWREAPRPEGQQRAARGLLGLAWLALLLGFAHEEEFVLLSAATGGLDPVALISVYAVAVLVSLVAVTLAMYAGFRRLEGRFNRIESHLPKLSAVALLALAILVALGIR